MIFPRSVIEEAFAVTLPATLTQAMFSSVSPAPGLVEPGGLYIAFPRDAATKFPHRDGQSDIDRAIAHGACGIVLERPTDAVIPPHIALVMTRDISGGFLRLARLWRARFTGPLVAVAGSVGKTTTTNLSATLLSQSGLHVHHTRDSQNGFIGLPLTLLGLREHHSAAIIEVGIDAPGQMAEHVSLIRPSIALVTAIAEEHLDALHDLATVAREECRVLDEVVASGGLAVISGNDEWLSRWYATHRPARCVRYGLGEPGSFELTGVADLDGEHVRVSGMGLSQLRVPLRLKGLHNATNLLGAIALARSFELDAEAIARAAEAATPVAGRSVVEVLQPGFTLIGDYFNANPRSMTAGLELLAGQAGRRWACLGDMIGLGDNEEQLHRAMAAPVMACGAQRVDLVGRRMRWLAEELAAKNFPGTVRHYDDAEPFALTLVGELRRGDTVLLKASFPVGFERVYRFLHVAAAAGKIGPAPRTKKRATKTRTRRAK